MYSKTKIINQIIKLSDKYKAFPECYQDLNKSFLESIEVSFLIFLLKKMRKLNAYKIKEGHSLFISTFLFMAK